MGPTMLFDKSFIQSLSVDESVWFDHFFYTAICPIFYVETLADLKKPKLHRSAEEEVGIIADKFPQMHSRPTPHHLDMAIGNLLGADVPLTGQIPIPGGRPVKSGEHTGIVYEPSPEAEAFRRWQSREFDAVEHEFASTWRSNLESFNLKNLANEFQQLGISAKSCGAISCAKSMSDTFVSRTGQTAESMKLAFLFYYFPDSWRDKILKHWLLSNCPPLSIYAPYAAYFLRVEMFFLISLAANHISADRPSNRSDIAYLYYLPFCQVFVSNDKLHRKCAPLFLREDQSFIWGHELKSALSELDRHYNTLPENQKEKGLMHIAPYPPLELNSIVSRLWYKHLPNWREHASESPRKLDFDPEAFKKLTNLIKAPSLSPNSVDFAPEQADVTSIGRRINKNKGKWWQLPHDLKNDGAENQS